jgi:hypothetical protein
VPGEQDGLGLDPLRRLIRGAALLALVGVAGATSAAERRVQITSFERIRVEGPFQVTIATGRSPTAVVSGDARRLDGVEVRVDGRTLVLRARLEGRSDAREAQAPIAVTLGTPTLAAASLLGGGALAVTGGRTQRLDLSIAGAGAIAWTGADADQVNATVIGNGQITLGGRAGRARLMVNGAGKVDADTLSVGDLTVLVDGPGEALARARFTATVTNTGLGRVAVAGSPKCTVRNAAGGPVSCGISAAPR